MIEIPRMVENPSPYQNPLNRLKKAAASTHSKVNHPTLECFIPGSAANMQDIVLCKGHKLGIIVLRLARAYNWRVRPFSVV